MSNKQAVKTGRSRYLDTLKSSPEFNADGYRELYASIEYMVRIRKNWKQVLKSLSTEDNLSSEIFLRLVEGVYGRPVTSYEDLLELTELESKFIPDITELYHQAQTERYEVLLKSLLRNGANYTSLLSITPDLFYLPPVWSVGGQQVNQDSVIAEAVGGVFSVGDYLPFRPNLRDVAEEIQAPLSVMIDIYERVHGWR
jgi:hypothetical protein